jgi:hypothetical protein
MKLKNAESYNMTFDASVTCEEDDLEEDTERNCIGITQGE